MRFKVPTVIKVGPHRVLIIMEAKLMTNSDKRGQARYDDCEIAIDPAMKNSMKTQTLLHELMHWLDTVYNNRNLSEDTVDGLASGLAILLDDLGVEVDWSDDNPVQAKKPVTYTSSPDSFTGLGVVRSV